MRLQTKPALVAGLLAMVIAAPIQAKQDERGNGNGNNGHQSHHSDYRDDRDRDHDRDRYEDRDRDRDRYTRPSDRIEEDVIRRIFRDNRDLVHRDSSLPPGIRKNLARGKPLPPGIAKQLDPRLANRLPHYDGYEWRQIDGDVVLAEVTTGIIESIIYDVLD
ncbi:anti-virulence regulator CigR family protein [Halopseudomonas sp.]|uniref:anti-virulence regulator CigR family protein n=1 Tax=Halopseudomonas sp. TaxID=2901191 RepID=UPI00311FFA38